MKTYTITKENFINWYYNTGDDDTIKDAKYEMGRRVIERLLSGEDFFFSVDDAFNECEVSYIPVMYLEEFKRDGYDELEVGDLEDICEVKLVN